MEIGMYSIGEVAKAFGLRASALRYYDDIGVLKPATRRSGTRLYGVDELRVLALIRMWHQPGLLSLADTTELIVGRKRADWREAVADAIAVLDDRIDRCQAARDVLAHSLACPCANPIRECPVLAEQLDGMIDAALGPAGEP